MFSLGLGITGPDMLAAARGGRYFFLTKHKIKGVANGGGGVGGSSGPMTPFCKPF